MSSDSDNDNSIRFIRRMNREMNNYTIYSGGYNIGARRNEAQAIYYYPDNDIYNFHELIPKIVFEQSPMNKNVLTELLKMFPDKEWDWDYLSMNPNISLEDIDNNPNCNWKYRFISNNPNITLQYVLDNINKNWDWQSLSSNPGITLQDINNNLGLRWNWMDILKNPNITLEFILEHYNDFINNHDSTRLTFQREISQEYMGDFVKEFRRVASAPNITLKDIINYPNIFWCKDNLSKNPNVTLDYILANPEIENSQNYWDWNDIGKRVSYQEIEYIFTNWYKLGIKYDNMRCFINGLSINPNITYDIICNNNLGNIDISFDDWNWDSVARNPSITLQNIMTKYNSSKRKILNNISENPNLTVEDIINNPNIHWNYRYLSKNKFGYCDQQPIIIRV